MQKMLLQGLKQVVWGLWRWRGSFHSTYTGEETGWWVVTSGLPETFWTLPLDDDSLKFFTEVTAFEIVEAVEIVEQLLFGKHPHV